MQEISNLILQYLINSWMEAIWAPVTDWSLICQVRSEMSSLLTSTWLNSEVRRGHSGNSTCLSNSAMKIDGKNRRHAQGTKPESQVSNHTTQLARHSMCLGRSQISSLSSHKSESSQETSQITTDDLYLEEPSSPPPRQSWLSPPNAQSHTAKNSPFISPLPPTQPMMVLWQVSCF